MYDDMTCVPVYAPFNYLMFSEEIDLPMERYDPSVGFGWLYADRH